MKNKVGIVLVNYKNYLQFFDTVKDTEILLFCV